MVLLGDSSHINPAKDQASPETRIGSGTGRFTHPESLSSFKDLYSLDSFSWGELMFTLHPSFGEASVSVCICPSWVISRASHKLFQTGCFQRFQTDFLTFISLWKRKKKCVCVCVFIHINKFEQGPQPQMNSEKYCQRILKLCVCTPLVFPTQLPRSLLRFCFLNPLDLGFLLVHLLFNSLLHL